MSARIIVSDVLEGLAQLEDSSVQCVVTSPPYWGLRDYGVAGQIGLEATPGEYVERIVAVFREVRRVMKPDATLWLNLGDSYAAQRGGTAMPAETLAGGEGGYGDRNAHRGRAQDARQAHRDAKTIGLKHKDLVGMPWMVAFALRADGWWLRSDIIWAKPNPMPESVTDRPTKSHEYLFLMSKSARYYYDSEAIAEPAESADKQTWPAGWASGDEPHGVAEFSGKVGRSGNKGRRPASDRGVPVDTNGSSSGAVAGSVPWEGSTRNKRSVWTVATQPFSEAHFATFPTALIEPCISAGSRFGDLVLDPFAGAGTVALVADRLGRDSIGIELNPEYAAIAERRIRGDSPLFAEVEVVPNG